MKRSGTEVALSALLDGVCCQYCKHFEQNECPVKTASPWSRWGNWCNVYEPNPDEPEAKPFPFTSNMPLTNTGAAGEGER